MGGRKESPVDAPPHRWVKVRVDEQERAALHAKAKAAGVSLSELIRQAVGRVRTWTAIDRASYAERTRELGRIGQNMNQISRWANTYKSGADAIEVVAHLRAIERELQRIGAADAG